MEPSSSNVDGYWVWRGGTGGVNVVFAGRGTTPAAFATPETPEIPEINEVLARVTGEYRPVAWLRQVHSARVLEASPGLCGDGDALVGRQSGTALAIVTADCVPVLIAGREAVAAAHAGWRGIVAGVVGATVEALGGSPEECVAWIGPAIGPCCYETGSEVAAQVTTASRPAVASGRPSGRIHLDLPGAVHHQLRSAGLREIHVLPLCTRCETAHLHSYRREGKGAGRNHAFIWRRAVSPRLS